MSFFGFIAPELINRIWVRIPRRIRVELGDINLLCAAVGTVHGKKQRLQILGQYYEVITGAAAGDNVTEAYTNCLAVWRAKREAALGAPFASDAAMEADMELQVRRFVVEDNALPARGAQKKVRYPGGYTFNQDSDLGSNVAPDGVALVSQRFAAEQTAWANNPAIGRIPLLITVEMQVAGNWVPAPNDWVHLQLLLPFYENNAQELNDVNALRATSQHYPPIPTMGPVPAPTAVLAGPKLFVRNAMNHSFDAADPQSYNCHSSRGGKRGNPLRGSNVDQNLFDSLPAAFPSMNAVQDSTHTAAVKVQTNAQGQAGVLFMPSRTAGDRYRMRFFLDPVSGHASDGLEAGAVTFETGRFEVHKHILLSNYLQKPAPVFPALNSVEGVQARLAVLLYDTGRIDNIDGTRTQGAVRHFQRNHPPLPQNGNWAHAATQARLDQEVTQYIGGGGPVYVRGFGPNFGPINLAFMQNQLRAAYTELELERNIADGTRRQITEAEWRDAFLWARGQAQANQGAYGLNAVRDVNAMFLDRFQTPYLFEIAHPNEYNRRRTSGPASPNGPPGTPHLAYWVDAQIILFATGGMLELFLRYINGRASAANPPTANLTRFSTPGLTIISALGGSSRIFWRTGEASTPVPAGNFFGSSWASGWAKLERGCFVFGGTGVYTFFTYQPDSFTSNTLHEFSHCLYMRHQFTGNNVGGVPNWNHAGWSFREDHDSPTAATPPVIPPPTPYDRCVMGYLPSEGELCGKCQLHLRGWNIQNMPV